ncbi:aromatic ring-hydroxylating oxygenase subunit alpha [Sphingobium sp. EP60837]|uniref:aromatic ring-hydroxylating oxygenase subunit alpha n=1 Tax=Sphingobium sp. EP60837 TaxID=1855519 RepID=UPI0007DDA4F1|nr:aromatic ring-hydroxylating dioxygenase subunit alpha [Sphingobium sp. EP60837]ANI79843.1 Choline monooxygenase, chloroplastic [Sphingobium sp. EP60837]
MDLEGWGLPAWTYRDPDFFALEIARIFRPAWQIAGHESDLLEPGDYLTFDYIGENIILIRGDDGAVRAFTNVCRHRGARIMDGAKGCAKKLICPYHGWTYDNAGQLTAVPGRAGYGELDRERLGLSALEVEHVHGFLFVRLEDDGGPSVAEMLAPYADDIAAYRFDQLRPLGRETLRPRAVNWKIIGENYCDTLHVGVAHPGLKRLMGESYAVDATEHADRMSGTIRTKPSGNPTERAYQHFLPQIPHLPPERQRLWTYIRLWPNIAFDIYPDQIDFMQWLPVSPTQTLIREIAYAAPDGRREMKAARYLNWRINRRVNAEDTTLLERVQAGLGSRSYAMGPLSKEEVALRHFFARMRRMFPDLLGNRVRAEVNGSGLPSPAPSRRRRGANAA